MAGFYFAIYFSQFCSAGHLAKIPILRIRETTGSSAAQNAWHRIPLANTAGIAHVISLTTRPPRDFWHSFGLLRERIHPTPCRRTKHNCESAGNSQNWDFWLAILGENRVKDPRFVPRSDWYRDLTTRIFVSCWVQSKLIFCQAWQKLGSSLYAAFALSPWKLYWQSATTIDTCSEARRLGCPTPDWYPVWYRNPVQPKSRHSSWSLKLNNEKRYTM